MEIYNYFSENREALESEKRSILLRIIVPDNEESRDQIIFATNNQTNIPKATLRVTDPIHLQIEMYFKSRGLFYDRRKNYYKNQGHKPAEIVGVSFLAQCLITIFLKKPDYARARPSTLLNDEKTYNELYEKNNDLEVFYRVALLGKKIQKNVRSGSDYSSAEKSDILYYVLYAVIADVLGKKNITPADIKNLDMDSVTDTLIEDIRNRVYEIYKQHGADQDSQQLSVFSEDGETIFRNGAEYQTHDTERSEADDPGNYLCQSIGNLIKHGFSGLACAAQANAEQHSPYQNADVIGTYNRLNRVAYHIQKQGT